MDYRCPACGADLGRRHKLGQSLVARMETDCPHCKTTIRLNVHRAENIVVLAICGMIVVLALLASWLEGHSLVLLVAGAMILGVVAEPLLDRTYLRAWPRYVVIPKPRP